MALTAEQQAELDGLLGVAPTPRARAPLGTPNRGPAPRPKATPTDEFLGLLNAPPKPPTGEISESKGFGGRVLERAGIPTTAEGWGEHYIRGPLGVLFSPFHALGEAVDTAAEALGKERPVQPHWQTPGGTPSISIGEMAEQAAGALPMGPVVRGAKWLFGGGKVPPPPPPPPPPLQLPQFTGMRGGERAMPGPDHSTPIGPFRKVPRAKYAGEDVELTLPTKYPTPEKIDEITTRYLGGAPKRPSEPSPGVVRPPLTPEGAESLSALEGQVSALVDPQGKPVVGAPPTPVGREGLRDLYKGRRVPRIDVEGRAPNVGPAEPDLPQGPTADFVVTPRRKAGLGPETRPKRPYEPPPSDVQGGPPPPPPPPGPVPPRTREQLRDLYKGRLSPREDLVGPGDTGRPFGEPAPWTAPDTGPPAPPKRPFAPDQPLDITGGTLEGPLFDPQGRPVSDLPAWFDPSRLPPKPPRPGPALSERDQLRAMGRTPLDAPPRNAPPDPEMPPGMPAPPPPGSPSPSGRRAVDPSVFGIEMDKGSAPMAPPAAGPTPNPELALRDYMAPNGTKVRQRIGDEVVEWTKTDRNEWQGWYQGQHRKLTGESALHLGANEIPQAPVRPAPAPKPVTPPPLTPETPETRAIAHLGFPAPPAPRDLLVNPRALPVSPPDVAPPVPEAPRFEPTAIGDQGVVPGAPDKAVPPGGLKASVPQADLKASGLFGQERAASERASEAAQADMRPRQHAAVQEWLVDQLGSTFAMALNRAKAPNQITKAVVLKLREMGITETEAWNVMHQEVPSPALLDRLAGLSAPKPALEAPRPPDVGQDAVSAAIARRNAAEAKQQAAIDRLTEAWNEGGTASGRREPIPQGNIRVDPEWRAARAEASRAEAELKAAQQATKVKKSNPNAFQAKGDWETGVPNLSDPDDVFAVIQGAGKIKVGEDLAGELRGVHAMFKSKNGQSLDRIAEGLIENYPHLGDGDIAAVKDQLIDTMSRYADLRRAKAATKAKGGVEWESSITGPKGETGAIAEEPGAFKTLMDFFSDIGTDESGALNLGNFGKAWDKAWRREGRKLPQEWGINRDAPNSPVIASIERATGWLADLTQQRTNQAWHKAVRKLDPEAIKDAEVAAVAEWKANGSTREAELASRHHFPPAVQAAMRQRDALFDQANRSREFFGVDPIDRWNGPYLPREVLEGRPAVSLRGEGFSGGQSLRTTHPGGHGEERAFETYRDGEARGLEYMDPRNALLARDFNDFKIRATHRLFQELEARGALTRARDVTQEAKDAVLKAQMEAKATGNKPLTAKETEKIREGVAAKADAEAIAKATARSKTGKPWKVEDAPGGTWWAPTEAEARFLQQNLKETGGGKFATLAHYANATFRNPNLVNPLPHVVKNMAFKMLLADGPVNTAKFARDSVEYFRGSNPTLLKEFEQAMPFSKAGRTSGELLERGMVKEGVSGGAKKLLELAGNINAPSRKVIFEKMDPAMRYSLFKHYREQGMDVFEAGNHAWVDLIRYGTRSDRIDFWKQIPLNFFVPWRFGTLVSLVKQAKNHPVRAALTVGAVEYIRESIYRNTGYWFHVPTDYAQKPIAELAQERGPVRALGTAVTTGLFGPGGDYAGRQLASALTEMEGKGNTEDWKRIKNAFWGISQVLDIPQDFARGDYLGLIGAATLGAHRAYNYEPRRFSRALPEWLPGMKKTQGMREAEEERADRQEKFDARAERRKERGPRLTIEEQLRADGYIK